jgi:hypothetical protein
MADTSWKVGDNYPQITFEFFQYLEEGGDSAKYTDKKYYNATIKYITPTGGLILEATDIDDMKTDDGMSQSIFTGQEIQKEYPDFTGDPDTEYCVLYEENSPFY